MKIIEKKEKRENRLIIEKNISLRKDINTQLTYFDNHIKTSFFKDIVSNKFEDILSPEEVKDNLTLTKRHFEKELSIFENIFEQVLDDEIDSNKILEIYEFLKTKDYSKIKNKRYSKISRKYNTENKIRLFHIKKDKNKEQLIHLIIKLYEMIRSIYLKDILIDSVNNINDEYSNVIDSNSKYITMSLYEILFKDEYYYKYKSIKDDDRIKQVLFISKLRNIVVHSYDTNFFSVHRIEFLRNIKETFINIIQNLYIYNYNLYKGIEK